MRLNLRSRLHYRRAQTKKVFVGIIFILFSVLAVASPGEILFVGDSHSVGCFGLELHKKLSPFARKMTTSAICGSSSYTWLTGPNPANCKGKGNLKCDPVCELKEGGDGGTLREMLDAAGPIENTRTSLIALGTNMLKDDQDQTMRDVGELIDEVKKSGSECVWIGPPQASEKFISIKDFNDFELDLKSTVENMGCTYISSSDKTSREDIKDKLGVHYSCSKGKSWAERVFSSLQEILKL